MPNAYISGTGAYVPPKVVTNDDLVKDFGMDTSHEWIHKRTGITERRFAEDGMGTAEMGTYAAEKAIENAGLQPKDIDMVIFATLSPDMAFPGSGVLMQQRLGLCDGDNATFVPCLDIRNQCSGFVYGLATAASMIRGGMHKNVLLVGSETHSHAIDLTTRGRTVSSLFGDGAAAVVVSATDEDRGVRTWSLGADGRHAETLCQRCWDMTRMPFIERDEDGNGIVPPEMMWAHMNGREVFKNAVERMVQALMQVCWDQGLTINDIDLFCFHQANMRINQYIAQMLSIPDDKMIHNIHKYGNTTAATIPLLLDEANRTGRLEPGMKVAMVAFGSGFTWGAAIADW